MTDSPDKKIVVTENGPYFVTGGVPLAVQIITPNDRGDSVAWTEGPAFPAKESYKLCRCGQSKTKPFCDGTHNSIAFDGTETASRVPVARQSERYDGPALTLNDAERLCAFARFCDVGGSIWRQVARTDQPNVRDAVIGEATHCPSGRLVLKDNATGKELEKPLAPSIGVIEDPAQGCSGPLWVRGGITVESADGKRYETRNRVTLCRCGASTNKPFCNGSHASIGFNDGLVGASGQG